MMKNCGFEGVCVLDENGENEEFLDPTLVIVRFCYDYGVIMNIYVSLIIH
jgi:hypothetical protein